MKRTICQTPAVYVYILLYFVAKLSNQRSSPR